MPRKPIRVFYSVLSERFYATRAWREVKPGLVEVTGEKWDVTNDIAGIIERHSVTFTKVASGPGGPWRDIDAADYPLPHSG